MSWSPIFLKASSIWKLLAPSIIFYTPLKRLFRSSFFFFCFLCVSFICNLQSQNWFSHVFISNFRCSKHVRLKSMFYVLVSNFNSNAFKPTFSPLLNTVFIPRFTTQSPPLHPPAHWATFLSILPPFSAFLVCLFLGSIRLVCLIVTFRGKFCVLTLSCLARSDVSFEKRILCGAVLPLIICFVSSSSPYSPTKNCF